MELIGERPLGLDRFVLGGLLFFFCRVGVNRLDLDVRVLSLLYIPTLVTHLSLSLVEMRNRLFVLGHVQRVCCTTKLLLSKRCQ